MSPARALAVIAKGLRESGVRSHVRLCPKVKVSPPKLSQLYRVALKFAGSPLTVRGLHRAMSAGQRDNPQRRRRRTAEKILRVRRLIRRGYTARDIALVLRCTTNSIEQFICYHGLRNGDGRKT